MTSIEPIDLLIVGSGPAGISTALHLVHADPRWADRMLVIDKAIHPREKLCGGGVTRPGIAILSNLGLTIKTPQIPIYQMQLAYNEQAFLFQEDTPFFHIIRRDEFDHWLVQRGRERGITIREGEAVTSINPQSDYVEITTEKATLHAKAVVAADGSRSLVRRKLKWHSSECMARLLEVLTPEPQREARYFQEGIAVFDFSPLQYGLQGYYWDFPSLIQNRPVMNRGIFDSRVQPARPRADLKQILQAALLDRRHDLADYPLKGHPIHWFDRHSQFSRPRIILAGDAAGVDPMVGEGISFALGYGPIAAATIQDAFARQDFSFATYRDRILGDKLLKELPRRVAFARFVYSLKQPWQIHLAWRLGGLITRGLRRIASCSVPFEPPTLINRINR